MNESFLSSHRYRRYYQTLEPVFKTRRVQAYLMVILSLFTISFFGFFAIRPTLKTIATLQRQIQDRAFLNEKLEAKINALIQAQDEYRRIESTLPLIYSLLPQQPEFPTLLRRLEILADENQATISSIQFDPIVIYGAELPLSITNIPADIPTAAESDSLTTPIFFTLTVTGDYTNLVTFLSQLTHLDRVATIHTVDLITNKTNEAQAQLSLDIQSRSYYYPAAL